MPSNHLPCYLSSKYEVSPNLSQSLGVCCNQCIGTPWSGNRSPAMRTVSSRVTFPQPISLLAPAFVWCGTLTMAGIPPKSNFVPELKGWKLDFARNLRHQLPSLPATFFRVPSLGRDGLFCWVTVFFGVIWLDFLEFFMDHLRLLGISDAWDTCDVSVLW